MLYIVTGSFIIAGEIRAQQDIIETATGIIKGLSATGMTSAITAYALIESGRTGMVLAHGIKNWLDKRDQEFRDKLRAEGRAEGEAKGIAKGRTEGHAEGEAKGRAEERSLWQEWNARRLDAESRGEPFTEPPPNGKVG